MLNAYSINNIILTSNYGWMEWRKVDLWNKGRELWVLLVFKSPGSFDWNPRRRAWHEHFLSVLLLSAEPVVHNLIPLHQSGVGRQSPGCDRQLITRGPSDQDSPGRARAPARPRWILNALAGRSASETDKRPEQTGYVGGVVRIRVC